MTQPLRPDQIESYRRDGFLHLPAVFSREETAALAADLDWMIRDWANVGVGWTGPWRRALMDLETETRSKLIAMHDLQFYSATWMAAVTRPDLAAVMSQLLSGEGDDRPAPVELHHSTMHVKPPETGHPFPMHQDWAFYEHADDRFVAALFHLDDTGHDNGEIRFLPGSHRLGPLQHITEFINERGEREACTQHLPWTEYRLEDTVAVPARAGDLVCFNIHTIHGSHINRTDRMRRLVRVGYRHPDNLQTAGQSCGRPGLMVAGLRRRAGGQLLFSTGEEPRPGARSAGGASPGTR